MVLWLITHNGKANENSRTTSSNDTVFNNREIRFALISLMLTLVLLFHKGPRGAKGSTGNSGLDGPKVRIM